MVVEEALDINTPQVISNIKPIMWYFVNFSLKQKPFINAAKIIPKANKEAATP